MSDCKNRNRSKVKKFRKKKGVFTSYQFPIKSFPLRNRKKKKKIDDCNILVSLGKSVNLDATAHTH